MKTRSKSLTLFGPAVLLVLFVVGGLAGRALGLPFPAAIVGLAFVLLGLRIGVMLASVEEQCPAPPRRIGPGADTREPALRAANG